MLCSHLWFITVLSYPHTIDDWIWAWHARIRRLLFLYTCHHHHYYMFSSSFSRDIIMCVNFYFHGPRRLCVGILHSFAYLFDSLLHFSLYCVYISSPRLFFVDNSCLRIIIRWLSLTWGFSLRDSDVFYVSPFLATGVEWALSMRICESIMHVNRHTQSDKNDEFKS